MTDIEEALDKEHVEGELGLTEAEQKLEFSETEKQLDGLESAIAIQDYNRAFNLLLGILSKSSVHRSKEDKIFSGFSETQIQYIATRFVGAVNFLFLQKTFRLNEQGFRHLVPYQSNYAAIVYLTPFQNCDHVIRRVLDMKEDGSHSDDISLHSFLKMLFLWSPYSKIQLPFKEFLQQYPLYMTPTILSTMRALNYIEENSHANREAIIQALAELGDYDLDFNDDQLASMAGPSWMNVSYATATNKYDAKKAINYSYKKWMERKGVQEPKLPAVRKIKEKPTLGIMNEALNRHHAMFRCFGETLGALRNKFYTIGFFCEGCVNKDVFDVFDEVVIMPARQGDIKKIVGKVVKKNPDVLLYTSIGMNNIMIPMANLRLAPIQIAFMGHPGATRSSVIDYIGIEDCQMSYTSVFSEKIVNMQSSSPMMMLEEHKSIVRLKKSEDKKQLDIVVPSMVMKLNHDFLSMLERIKNNVSRNICYHFFPNILGISLNNARKAIHNILPGSIVHPPYAYRHYLTHLSACDIHFGPFPFNNTNGDVDSLVAGLPMVVLRGDPNTTGVEGVADVLVLQNAGAPSEMIADNLDEYFSLACRMIDDDEFRKGIADKVANIRLNTSLFETQGAFQAADAIWDLYLNHEHYQASDIRLINPRSKLVVESEAS